MGTGAVRQSSVRLFRNGVLHQNNGRRPAETIAGFHRAHPARHRCRFEAAVQRLGRRIQSTGIVGRAAADQPRPGILNRSQACVGDDERSRSPDLLEPRYFRGSYVVLPRPALARQSLDVSRLQTRRFSRVLQSVSRLVARSICRGGTSIKQRVQKKAQPTFITNNDWASTRYSIWQRCAKAVFERRQLDFCFGHRHDGFASLGWPLA